MKWTAIVPFKAKPEPKSRLADALTAPDRIALARRLLAHVTQVLGGHREIEETVLLAAERPQSWTGPWIADQGRGLNGELEAARLSLGERWLLIVHADLPLLRAAELDALLGAAARSGSAIAPDRHGSGTNALALCDASVLAFCFGPDSFRRHRAQLPDAAIVKEEGLGLDLDTPADLARAIARGFRQ